MTASPARELTNLRSVREYRSDPGSWLVAVDLDFDEAVLHIERINDTDEISLRVAQRSTLLEEEDAGSWREVSTDEPWQELIGTDASYWWVMTNQRGYDDGVQVEFAPVGGGTPIRLQWITEAAYLRVAVVGEQIM